MKHSWTDGQRVLVAIALGLAWIDLLIYIAMGAP